MTLPCVLLLALVVRAEPNKRFQSKDKKLSVAVPASWKPAPRETKNDAVLIVDGDLPDKRGPVLVVVESWDGAPLDTAAALHQMRHDVETWRPAKLLIEPRPHLRKTEDKNVRLVFPLRQRGRGVLVYALVPLAEVDALMADLVRIVDSAKTTRAAYPAAPPASFRRIEKRGVILFVEDKKLDTRELLKALKSSQRDFERFHGKIGRPKDTPLEIVYYRERRSIRDIEPQAAASKNPFFPLSRNRRAYVPAPNGEGWAANIAGMLTSVLIGERYGIARPQWFVDGEFGIAYSKARTGKKKVVPPEFQQRVHSITVKRLDKLDDVRNNRDEYLNQSWLYVHMFRYGPAQYRKAYKAFVKDFAETRDAPGAAKRHILSLDQAALLAAAGEHREKLKVAD